MVALETVNTITPFPIGMGVIHFTSHHSKPTLEGTKMIVNGAGLLLAAPIKDMATNKQRYHGVSWGLAEAGYDIRIKQEIYFYYCNVWGKRRVRIDGQEMMDGRFCKASAIEEFQMPKNLLGLVKDKSTWAREGLSVFNTVIEPGWNGFLTLELVHHGNENLLIPAGAGIAQVLFERTETAAQYTGKYQDQDDRPVAAIYEKG